MTKTFAQQAAENKKKNKKSLIEIQGNTEIPKEPK